MIEPRFPITQAEIDDVVAAFYARVRQHNILGPVFGQHVTDWPSHEAKVARFWANAILGTGGYDGNPQRVHKAAGNVRVGMFTPWLATFDAVLAERLRPEQAQAWSSMAHRIGRGLSLGMQDYGGIPNLSQGPN